MQYSTRWWHKDIQKRHRREYCKSFSKQIVYSNMNQPCYSTLMVIKERERESEGGHVKTQIMPELTGSVKVSVVNKT